MNPKIPCRHDEVLRFDDEWACVYCDQSFAPIQEMEGRGECGCKIHYSCTEGKDGVWRWDRCGKPVKADTTKIPLPTFQVVDRSFGPKDKIPKKEWSCDQCDDKLPHCHMPDQEECRPSDDLIKAYIERAIGIHEAEEREFRTAILELFDEVAGSIEDIHQRRHLEKRLKTISDLFLPKKP